MVDTAEKAKLCISSLNPDELLQDRQLSKISRWWLFVCMQCSRSILGKAGLIFLFLSKLLSLVEAGDVDVAEQ